MVKSRRYNSLPSTYEEGRQPVYPFTYPFHRSWLTPRESRCQPVFLDRGPHLLTRETAPHNIVNLMCLLLFTVCLVHGNQFWAFLN